MSVRQQFQDLRLDGDVERGGRLVGDQQLRVVRQRRGDHHPLALAAGELVRIGVEPFLGIRQPGLVQQVQHAVAQRARPASGWCRVIASPTWRAMVCSGFSEVIGSWKTMPATPPRRRWSAASSAVRTSVPSRVMRPVGLLRRGRQQAQGGEGGDGLAAAALADQGDRLAAVDVEGDAAHDGAGAEGDREVLDAEQGHGKKKVGEERYSLPEPLHCFLWVGVAARQVPTAKNR